MKKIFPLLLLASLAFAQERKIKPGDAIEIVVYGHQELTRVVTVSPNGAIDFPFMQSVPVDGMTLDKLREIVVAQLSRYLNTYPVVTLSFSKSNTMVVSVLGMVKNPGLISMPLNSTLQGALAAAGGLLPGARHNEVTVSRDIDGRSVANAYDLEKFILEADMKQNPVVNDGDVIMVTGNPTLSNIKVIGAVRSPGIFEPAAGATVLDMLMRAGGPMDDANIKKVRLISPSRSKSMEYSIDLSKAFSSSSYYKLPIVKPGDVIYVPKKHNYWKSALAVARDVSTLALAAYYIVRIND